MKDDVTQPLWLLFMKICHCPTGSTECQTLGFSSGSVRSVSSTVLMRL